MVVEPSKSGSPPALQVVHATHDSAKVWLVGDRRYPSAHLWMTRVGGEHTESPHLVELEAVHGYMAVETIADLVPDTEYLLDVRFPRRSGLLTRVKEFFSGPSKPVELHRRLHTSRKLETKPKVVIVPTKHDSATLWAVADQRYSGVKVKIESCDPRKPYEGEDTGPLVFDAANRHCVRTTILELKRETRYQVTAEFTTDPSADRVEPVTEFFQAPIDPEAPRLLLVIGHTRHDSTVIWVRGDKRHEQATIELFKQETEPTYSKTVSLGKDTDFTAATLFAGLESRRRYTVKASFAGEPGEELHGELCTFPDPADPDRTPERFSFLHGSCNLSTVAITNMGSLAVSGFGWVTASRALLRPTHSWHLGRFSWLPTWVRRLLQKIIPALSEKLLGLVGYFTRFEQPEQFAESPFRNLYTLVTQGLKPGKRTSHDEAESPEDGKKGERPAFMIHAGDQIYFDIPMPRREPERDKYRREYVNAWAEDLTLRSLLANCPHYMTLDDHEIVDGFATDQVPEPPPTDDDGKPYTADRYLESASRAYSEYVHSRHPGGTEGDGKPPFHYEFEYGETRFFVLDTRTERSLAQGRMIGDGQWKALTEWLVRHRDDLKFVVSSIPFLAELNTAAAPVDSSPPDIGDSDGDSGGGRVDATDKPVRETTPWDKWCGEPFRGQRDQLLELLHREGIGRLVFLVGDMHCAYHCTSRVGGPGNRITLHEIAGGPFHQLLFTSRDRFQDHYRGTTTFSSGDGRQPLTTWIRAFNSTAVGAMLISVIPGDSPEIAWEVIRMHQVREKPRSMTRLDPNQEKPLKSCENPEGRPEIVRRPLAGRISF